MSQIQKPATYKIAITYHQDDDKNTIIVTDVIAVSLNSAVKVAMSKITAHRVRSMLIVREDIEYIRHLHARQIEAIVGDAPVSEASYN